jgi:hypothetical protein
MRVPVLVVLSLSALSTPSVAAASGRVKVAGVTLEAPDGWTASNQSDGSATLISPEGTIAWRFFATERSTDLEAWFDEGWASLTSAHASVSAGPAQQAAAGAGLTGRVGAGAMFEAKGTRHILIFSVVSNGTVVVPMLIEFADEAAFARRTLVNAPSESIELVAGSAPPKTPFARGGWRYPLGGAAGAARDAVPARPAPASAAAPANAEKLAFLGRWSGGQSSTNQRDGVSFGSRIYEYDFQPGGSYSYHSEAWGGTFGSNWFYVIDEKGQWQASGDLLTVAPVTVTGVVRDLAGKVQQNGGPPPETVTYRFQTTYFSGVRETQLVLTPGRQTKRDGPFAANAAFPNSYLLRTNVKPGFRFPP